MKKLLLFIVLITGTTGCNGQQKQNEKTPKVTAGPEHTDSKPEVNWKVNKRYDDKGNLVEYDSTYTWSYSDKSGKMQQINPDSVMMEFRKKFDSEFPPVFNRNFGNPIWTDSLFYKDFATPDYFMRKWNNHYFDMRKMMREMDSLRNSFLKNNYPGLNIEGREQKM